MTLIAEHREELLGFLLGRLPRDAAEDILQDVLARSLERIDTLRDDDAVLAWVYRSLRNAAVDHHRRAGAAARALAGLAREPEHATADVGAPQEGEPCRCVLRAAETLAAGQARALQRVAVDGVAVKSFAEEEGISAGNAAVRLHRARHALRESLVARCGSCAGANGRGCSSCSCGRDDESL